MSAQTLLEKAFAQDRNVQTTASNPLMQPPIIIAGMYRGGTSLATALFSLCGAWTGYTMEGNQFNPKGYFENESLKSVLHTMLHMSGYNDSDDLPPEDLLHARIGTERLHHMLEILLLAEGYKEGPWVMKNPKIPFFWRYFDAIYPDAKWVIVRRDKQSVIKSMQRVNVLTIPPRSLPLDDAKLGRIVDGYDMRLDSITRQIPGDRLREISSDDLVSGKLDDLQEIIEWAGLDYNQDKIDDFIEPKYFSSSENASKD